MRVRWRLERVDMGLAKLGCVACLSSTSPPEYGRFRPDAACAPLRAGEGLLAQHTSSAACNLVEVNGQEQRERGGAYVAGRLATLKRYKRPPEIQADTESLVRTRETESLREPRARRRGAWSAHVRRRPRRLRPCAPPAIPSEHEPSECLGARSAAYTAPACCYPALASSAPGRGR